MASTGIGHDARFAEAWRTNRSYLVDLAFGMVGNIATAEDAVQEAFARLARTDLQQIEEVSRLAHRGDHPHLPRSRPGRLVALRAAVRDDGDGDWRRARAGVGPGRRGRNGGRSGYRGHPAGSGRPGDPRR